MTGTDILAQYIDILNLLVPLCQNNQFKIEYLKNSIIFTKLQELEELCVSFPTLLLVFRLPGASLHVFS